VIADTKNIRKSRPLLGKGMDKWGGQGAQSAIFLSMRFEFVEGEVPL